MGAPASVTIVWIPVDRWDGRGQGVLSADEMERAARFKSEPARRTFIACRVALRNVVGAVTGIAPGDVDIRLADGGKPFIPAGPAIGLSHSGTWGAVALGPGRLGIDLEVLREMDDANGVAKYLAPAERERIVDLPAERRSAALLRLWTVKESVLKASGIGIAAGLDGFVAMTEPWRPGEPISMAGPAADGWVAAALHSPPGTVAALAWEGDDLPAIRSWTWSWRSLDAGMEGLPAPDHWDT